MISFKNLDDVLKISLRWEHKLKDFYDVAEVALQNAESKQVVGLLRSKLQEKLDVLEAVKPGQHGKTAWIRYLGDYDEGELIGIDEIKRTSSPSELFHHIITYQGKLKSFYATVAEKITVQGQKELFESLALFKSEQIEELNRLMRVHEEG